jgi:hypothetical protein
MRRLPQPPQPPQSAQPPWSAQQPRAPRPPRTPHTPRTPWTPWPPQIQGCELPCVRWRPQRAARSTHRLLCLLLGVLLLRPRQLLLGRRQRLRQPRLVRHGHRLQRRLGIHLCLQPSPRTPSHARLQRGSRHAARHSEPPPPSHNHMRGCDAVAVTLPATQNRHHLHTEIPTTASSPAAAAAVVPHRASAVTCLRACFRCRTTSCCSAASASASSRPPSPPSSLPPLAAAAGRSGVAIWLRTYVGGTHSAITSNAWVDHG